VGIENEIDAIRFQLLLGRLFFDGATTAQLTERYTVTADEVAAAWQFCRRKLSEELGDMLLHVVMLSNMADEKSRFSMSDVIDTIQQKMIRRHPHVFGEIKLKKATGLLTATVVGLLTTPHN